MKKKLISTYLDAAESEYEYQRSRKNSSLGRRVEEYEDEYYDLKKRFKKKAETVIGSSLTKELINAIDDWVKEYYQYMKYKGKYDRDKDRDDKDRYLAHKDRCKIYEDIYQKTNDEVIEWMMENTDIFPEPKPVVEIEQPEESPITPPYSFDRDAWDNYIDHLNQFVILEEVFLYHKDNYKMTKELHGSDSTMAKNAKIAKQNAKRNYVRAMKEAGNILETLNKDYVNHFLLEEYRNSLPSDYLTKSTSSFSSNNIWDPGFIVHNTLKIAIGSTIKQKDLSVELFRLPIIVDGVVYDVLLKYDMSLHPFKHCEELSHKPHFNLVIKKGTKEIQNYHILYNPCGLDFKVKLVIGTSRGIEVEKGKFEKCFKWEFGCGVQNIRKALGELGLAKEILVEVVNALEMFTTPQVAFIATAGVLGLAAGTFIEPGGGTAIGGVAGVAGAVLIIYMINPRNSKSCI